MVLLGFWWVVVLVLCFGHTWVDVPRPVATLGLPPLCFVSRDYDWLVRPLRVRASLVFVAGVEVGRGYRAGRMRDRPRFRGLRPAPCYWCTT